MLKSPVLPVTSVTSYLLQDAREKPSKQFQKAIDWLNEHPEHINTPSRDISALVGVSHMTVNRAQRYIKNL